MRRGRIVLVLALVIVAAAAACGGAVAFDDPSSGDTTSVPSRGPRNGGHPAFDASRYPYDAAPPTCACDMELEQLDGSCDFTIGQGLIDCVADHSDGGSYSPLGTAVECKFDGGATTASWTPSTTPNQLTLCGCTPGEVHSLCAKYY